MVMDKSEARSEYRAGLDQIGEPAYRAAMNADTVKEAAEALERESPDAEVDFNQYERSYANKYS